MELTLVSSFLFLAFIYTVVKLVRGNRSPHHDHLNQIPGPRRLPLIGNLHLLAGKSLPHRVFRDLAAKHGPLMRLQLGEIPFLVVSSVDVAKQVLRTHDVVFANRMPMLPATTITYNYKDIAMAPYGEHWRQLRRICTLELLSARRVRSFRHIREEENLNLAKWIASNAGSPVNLSEGLRLSSSDVVTRSSVGSRTQDRGLLAGAILDTLKIASGLDIVDLFPSNPLLPLITGVKFKIARIFRVTDEIFQSIIDQHRAKAAAAADHDNDDDADDEGAMEQRREDLVDVLLKIQREEAKDNFHLATDTIKAVILDVLFGGTDTAATTAGWAMSELIKNPTTMKRAQDEVRRAFDYNGYVDEDKFGELKFLKLVIKETLRLHPPLPLLLPRMSSERCEINGYQVGAGTRVMINAWALGRDPNHWNEADKFKPERFEDGAVDFKGTNLEFLPFGSGRRICPGMNMGLANVEFTLATLLYHFEWEMPFGMKNQELDMEEDFGATIKRNTDLLLIPTVERSLPATAASLIT